MCPLFLNIINTSFKLSSSHFILSTQDICFTYNFFSRRLRRVKEDEWGKMPTAQEDFKPEVMETMADGSKMLWAESYDEKLQRTLIFTIIPLLPLPICLTYSPSVTRPAWTGHSSSCPSRFIFKSWVIFCKQK